VIPLNSCAYTYTGNFGSAVSQGADLQFLNTPLRGLEFGGSLAYTNARSRTSRCAQGAKFSSWDIFAFINNLTDNSTPLFEDVGTKPGSYGAEAIRSISLRPRTLGFDVTYRY
jgi:hypothetical protein